MPPGTKNNLKMREAKRIVLDCFALGMTVQQAMDRVGRQKSTYLAWAKDDPEFLRMARSQRERFKSPDLKQYDFIDFRKRFFAMETFPHQRRIVEAIEDAEEGAVILILLPPEAGKTTLVEDWICYKLALNPNTRIGIISENKELAQKRISRIATRMTTPERFADFILTWGPFRVPGHDMSKPWNSERLTVEKADHDERDPSIEAKGAGTALYGIRWNFVILDDIQSLKSLNRTESLIEFFRQEIFTRVGQSGKFVIVGTRVGPGDFYEELLKLELVSDFVSIPALDEHGKSYWPAAYNADGKRLRMPSGDPIGWTEPELEKRRRMVGEESWARVYMQQASSRAGATFSAEMLERAKDYTRTITSPALSPGIIMGLDPALTNFAGYIVGNYTATHLHIVDGESAERLLNYDAIFDVSEHYISKWRADEVVIESNNIQRGIARDSRIKNMQARYGFTIVEHATGVNKFDPKIGVASMASAFMRGEITIAYGDEDTVGKLEQLFEELRRWRFDVPSKQLRQDMVMALWFVYLRWLRKRDLLGYTQDGWRRPGLSNYTTLSTIRSLGRGRNG